MTWTALLEKFKVNETWGEPIMKHIGQCAALSSDGSANRGS